VLRGYAAGGLAAAWTDAATYARPMSERRLDGDSPAPAPTARGFADPVTAGLRTAGSVAAVAVVAWAASRLSRSRREQEKRPGRSERTRSAIEVARASSPDGSRR
jgi:hypothetical protein